MRRASRSVRKPKCDSRLEHMSSEGLVIRASQVCGGAYELSGSDDGPETGLAALRHLEHVSRDRTMSRCYSTRTSVL
jgi:hypothetical protein